MKVIFIACALLLGLSVANAQNYSPPSKATLKDYRKNPRWIEMMANPSANYFEASIAFDEFWKGKPNPVELLEGEEHEHEGEAHERVSEREREELIQYAMDYKKFRFWQIQHQGFIHADGTIMTEDEIQALVQQELQNRQNSK